MKAMSCPKIELHSIEVGQDVNSANHTNNSTNQGINLGNQDGNLGNLENQHGNVANNLVQNTEEEEKLKVEEEKELKGIRYWNLIRTKVKYFLSLVRRHQTLIEVYSRELSTNSKPTQQIEQAQTTIYKSKQKIRDLVRIAETHFGSAHIIPESAWSDGGVDVENICCAICGSQDSTTENDILLCDRGGCNRGFHQLCLDPQIHNAAELADDWFCPSCACVSDCMKYINDDFYTHYTSYTHMFPDVGEEEFTPIKLTVPKSRGRKQKRKKTEEEEKEEEERKRIEDEEREKEKGEEDEAENDEEDEEGGERPRKKRKAGQKAASRVSLLLKSTKEDDLKDEKKDSKKKLNSNGDEEENEYEDEMEESESESISEESSDGAGGKKGKKKKSKRRGSNQKRENGAYDDPNNPPKKRGRKKEI